MWWSLRLPLSFLWDVRLGACSIVMYALGGSGPLGWALGPQGGRTPRVL